MGALFGKLDSEKVLKAESTEKSRSQAATAAQWFVDHEIAVVPTNGKTPIGGVNAAKLSVEGIKNGYGIALGNGYIAIDFDEHDGATNFEIFSATRTWRSGSDQGYGIIYKVPKELSLHGGKIATGVTVRAVGSIIVGPGSVHPGNPQKKIKAGGIYTLVKDVEIEEAPDFILEFLRIFKDRATQPLGVNEAAIARPEWLFSDKKFTEKLAVGPLAGDRSAAVYSVCSYATERGATNEEIAWIVTNSEAAKDKGNAKEEIPRLLGKLREKHPHPGFPCDKAECPNKPAWMGKELEVLDVFEARPELAYIKQAAFSRQRSPKAVLMAVIARAIASIPIEFVIPPIIGAPTSLNFFVCFVGSSSDGKGTSTKLAESLFNFKQTGVLINNSIPASGEGVVSSYLGTDTKQKYESCLVNFDEIDQFTASSDRSGSTLGSTIRQGFMGEVIGGNYSKTVKKLESNSYRMAFQLSAQPLKSRGFMADNSGGTPHRFLFVQTSNPELPAFDDLPEFPAPIKWSPPDEVLAVKKRRADRKKAQEEMGDLLNSEDEDTDFIEIEVDPVIVREIQLYHYNCSQKGKAPGHHNLVRLKASLGLAYLNGRMNITPDDWKLSRVIMQWSRQAENEIKEALEHETMQIESRRATAAVNKQISVNTALENKAVIDTANNILKHAKAGLTKLSGTGQIRTKIKADKRVHIDEAIAHLVEHKKVKFNEETTEITLLDK
jgi:hypothetical protein